MAEEDFVRVFILNVHVRIPIPLIIYEVHFPFRIFISLNETIYKEIKIIIIVKLIQYHYVFDVNINHMLLE